MVNYLFIQLKNLIFPLLSFEQILVTLSIVKVYSCLFNQYLLGYSKNEYFTNLVTTDRPNVRRIHLPYQNHHRQMKIEPIFIFLKCISRMMEYCVIIQYVIPETWLKYTAWLSIPLFVIIVPKTIITQHLSILSCTFRVTNQNIVFTMFAQS